MNCMNCGGANVSSSGCDYCGSIPDAPSRLKTVRSDMGKYGELKNVHLIGDMNQIKYAENCIIEGDMNRIKASKSITVKGDMNTY